MVITHKNTHIESKVLHFVFARKKQKISQGEQYWIECVLQIAITNKTWVLIKLCTCYTDLIKLVLQQKHGKRFIAITMVIPWIYIFVTKIYR